MSIIKQVTLQKIVAHDFRYDPRNISRPVRCDYSRPHTATDSDSSHKITYHPCTLTLLRVPTINRHRQGYVRDGTLLHGTHHRDWIFLYRKLRHDLFSRLLPHTV